MKTTLTLFFLSLGFMGFPALASPQWDQEYSFKNFVVAVINADKEPIHGDQVEGQLIGALRNNLRFEFSDSGYLYLKDALKRVNPGTLREPAPEKLEFLRPTLKELSNQGIGAAILAELLRKGDGYEVVMVLVTTPRGELVYHVTEQVQAPISLELFSQAARTGLTALLKSIPFDASIIRRDGYLVIIDQGSNVFRPGSQLPTYSIEMQDGNMVFDETGLIALTRVEDNVSFGRILVERKPKEVLQGNKIKVADKLLSQLPVDALVDTSSANRQPSAIFSDFEVSKGSLGKIGFDLGAQMVNFTNTDIDGVEFPSNLVYPGGRLFGELWFTSRVFLDMSLGFYKGSFANVPGQAGKASGAGLNSFRAQLGYRMNVTAPDPGPVVYTKFGFGSQSYEFEGAAEPLLFASVSYSGAMLTGGVSFPVNDQLGVGAEINTLIFPGATETPVTSGIKPTGVSSWDLALRTYYSFNAQTDVEAKLVFQNSSAEYEADGTRFDAIKKTAQSSKAIIVGVTYYF